eukprot:scaffold129712_cov21-Tisochrysis_lutea.AAC.1
MHICAHTHIHAQWAVVQRLSSLYDDVCVYAQQVYAHQQEVAAYKARFDARLAELHATQPDAPQGITAAHGHEVLHSPTPLHQRAHVFCFHVMFNFHKFYTHTIRSRCTGPSPEAEPQEGRGMSGRDAHAFHALYSPTHHMFYSALIRTPP